MKRIHLIEPYAGMPELIAAVGRKVPVAIVTSGKNDYCEAIVRSCKLRITTSVGYEDTEGHKPDPAPLLTAAQRLNVDPAEIVAVGDHYNDIVAANKAGMISVAALWGCTAKRHILEAPPSHVCETVPDLANLLK